MGPDQLTTTIREIVAQETDLPPGSLSLDTPLESLGIDSLDVLKLAARFEQAFDVTISTSELQEVTTLADIAEGLRLKLAS